MKSKLRYHDHMTQCEIAEFMAGIQELDACYESVPEPEPAPQHWEDPIETLRRAALDHQGRP